MLFRPLNFCAVFGQALSFHDVGQLWKFSCRGCPPHTSTEFFPAVLYSFQRDLFVCLKLALFWQTFSSGVSEWHVHRSCRSRCCHPVNLLHGFSPTGYSDSDLVGRADCQISNCMKGHMCARLVPETQCYMYSFYPDQATGTSLGSNDPNSGLKLHKHLPLAALRKLIRFSRHAMRTGQGRPCS